MGQALTNFVATSTMVQVDGGVTHGVLYTYDTDHATGFTDPKSAFNTKFDRISFDVELDNGEVWLQIKLIIRSDKMYNIKIFAISCSFYKL